MRLLVAGSRHWSHRAVLEATLTELRPTAVAHGCCRSGADAMADAWALRHQVPVQRFRARWRRRDGSLDRNAGPVRNQAMLKGFGPDLVVVFKHDFDWRVLTDPTGRGYGGTEHMVFVALGAGATTRVVDSTGAWTETLPPVERTAP